MANSHRTGLRAVILTWDKAYHLVGDEKLTRELVGYAIALTRRRDIAEDLVQDVWLRVVEGAGIPDDPSRRRGYLFRMVRNAHIDALRKDRVRREYIAREERLISDAPVKSAAIDEQIGLRDCVLQLSADHREIVLLIDVIGLTYQEAAETLDVAQGTIMSRISRARKKLIEIMEMAPETRSDNQANRS